MFRVGLTGNIGSGKSSVAACWRELGAQVVDADVLAREAVRPGSEGLRRVTARFGPAVVDARGRLDRGALRDVVFRDASARRDLEAILHPEVERLRRAAEARHVAEGTPIIVHEIPLLFEVGLAGGFDGVVLVDAPEEQRLQRIVESRGVAPDVARAMIDAQQPAAEKRNRARWIIDNDGTRQALRERAAAVWREIEAEAGRCA